MENIFKDLVEWIATYGSFSVLAVPFFIELFFTYVHQPTSKVLNSVFTFLIAIACAFGVWVAGMWFDIGFLKDISIWWHVVLYGLGAGLVANWTWVNIDWVKAAIEFILKGKTETFMVSRKK